MLSLDLQKTVTLVNFFRFLSQIGNNWRLTPRICVALMVISICMVITIPKMHRYFNSTLKNAMASHIARMKQRSPNFWGESFFSLFKMTIFSRLMNTLHQRYQKFQKSLGTQSPVKQDMNLSKKFRWWTWNSTIVDHLENCILRKRIFSGSYHMENDHGNSMMKCMYKLRSKWVLIE